METDSPENFIRFSCKICEMIFTEEKEIDAHIIHNHQQIPTESNKLFRCSICGITFSFKLIMVTHIKDHIRKAKKPPPGPQFFSCEVCNETFDRKIDSIRHKKVHREKKPFKCSFCEKRFPSVYHHQIHERTHTGERPFKCKVCHKTFDRKSTLLSHAETHLTEKLKYVCSICQKEFSLKTHFKRHSSLHNNKRVYFCDVCCSFFDSKEKLTKHNMSGHRNDENEKVEGEMNENLYYCDGCGKSLVRRRSLNYHLFLNSNDGPYTCNSCGEMFEYKCALGMHRKAAHLQMSQYNNKTDANENEPLFNCKECGRFFNCKKYLTYHLTKSIKNGVYNCVNCAEVFKFACALRKHVRTIHSKSRPFRKDRVPCNCKQCGQLLSCEESLKKHLNGYSKDGPFNCNVCKDVFNYACALRKHMKVIHNETCTGYECDSCDKSFKNFGSLRKHVKATSKQASYKCALCEKSFKQKCGLLNHGLKIHPGENLFFCKVCKKSCKSFYKDSLLEHHMKIHTGDNQFCCYICYCVFTTSSELKLHLSTKHTNDDLAQGGPTLKIEVEGDDIIIDEESNGCKVITDTESGTIIKKEVFNDYDDVEEGEVDITDMIEELNDSEDETDDEWSSGDDESISIEIKEEEIADVYFPEVVFSRS